MGLQFLSGIRKLDLHRNWAVPGLLPLFCFISKGNSPKSWTATWGMLRTPARQSCSLQPWKPWNTCSDSSCSRGCCTWGGSGPVPPLGNPLEFLPLNTTKGDTLHQILYHWLVQRIFLPFVCSWNKEVEQKLKYQIGREKNLLVPPSMQQAAHGRAEKEPNIYFYDVKCGISSSFSETLRNKYTNT